MYQTNEYLASVKESVEAQGSDVNEYLTANYGYTAKEFVTNVKKMMKRNLKQQMYLTMIADKEKLEIDKNELDEYIESFVSYYGYKNKKELYKDYPKSQLETAFICNKATDYLVNTCKVNYKATEATPLQ